MDKERIRFYKKNSFGWRLVQLQSGSSNSRRNENGEGLIVEIYESKFGKRKKYYLYQIIKHFIPQKNTIEINESKANGYSVE